MANLQAPYGFKHIGRIGGAAPNFANQNSVIQQGYATPIFFGDPVIRLPNGYLAKAPAGATQIHGVFIGCEYLSIALGYKTRRQFYPGSDAAADVTAWIISDPSATFQVQTGNSTVASLVPAVAGGPVPTPANQSLVGLNVGIGIGFATSALTAANNPGNLLSGTSYAFADLSTAAVTPTLPFRIAALVSDPPGVNGTDLTTGFNDIIVTFNNQDFKSLTGI